MICPTCQELDKKEVEMQLEESINDYYDPTRPDGHGQIVTKFWLCPICKSEEDLFITGDEDESDVYPSDTRDEGAISGGVQDNAGEFGQVDQLH